MMKRLLLALLVLVPTLAYAAEINMFEAHLAAAYGAKIDVATSDGARQATAYSGDGRQAVRLTGAADEYDKAEAQVDMRAANVIKGRGFLIEVARAMIADTDWPLTERFIAEKMASLTVGEKARHVAGGWVLELERSSETMVRLIVAQS